MASNVLFCLLPRTWSHWRQCAYRVDRKTRLLTQQNLMNRLGVDRAEARRLAIASMKVAGVSTRLPK